MTKADIKVSSITFTQEVTLQGQEAQDFIEKRLPSPPVGDLLEAPENIAEGDVHTEH